MEIVLICVLAVTVVVQSFLIVSLQKDMVFALDYILKGAKLSSFLVDTTIATTKRINKLERLSYRFDILKDRVKRLEDVGD